MRIVIDMQGLQTKFSGHRGVGRYTENLVKNLLDQNKTHEIYLALNGAFPDSADLVREKFGHLLPKKNIVTWQLLFQAPSADEHGQSLVAASCVIREVFLNSLQPDLIFSTNLQEGLFETAPTSVHQLNFPVLYCTTLHDLVPFYYEDKYLANPAVRNWYTKKIDYAKASDIVLAPSHSTKVDIIEKLGLPPEKVIVIENGYDDTLFHVADNTHFEKSELFDKYKIDFQFFLYVGGNDPHKNIERLLIAYSKLPANLRKSTKFVFGGREFSEDKNFFKLSQDLGIADSVITLGFVPDEDLPKLYRLCTCFVFPSTHEGFGLPALEAMACGAAVIGSNSSSIREIINYEPALFDPYDVDSICRKLEDVLTDRNLHTRLSANGLVRAGVYSWQRSAQDLLRAFDGMERTIGKKGYRFDDPIEITTNALAPYVNSISDANLARIAESVTETFPAPRMKRIHFDVSSVVLHDDKSGIQRVVRAIAAEMLKNPPEEFDVELVYTSTESMEFYAAHEYSRRVFNAKVSPHDEQIDFTQGDILIYLDLHPGVAISHKETTKYLRNKGVEVFHVVYDILPILKPDFFWPELCKEFALWADAVSASDGAICISKAVANELSTYFSVFGEIRATPFKIGFFHLGADIQNSAPTRGLPENAVDILKQLNSKLTFLMVGTLEPRKGYRQTLAAFDLLWQQGIDINLVMVGREGWGMQDFAQEVLSHPRLLSNLFWLKGISDEYLDEVYRASSCLIAASEGEGFGLPLIEAAQYGKPIIARDIPVFKEVAGDCAFYFPNDKDPKILSRSVTDWINLQKREQHPRSENMGWLSWEQSAENMLDVVRLEKWEHVINCKGALHEDLIQGHHSKRIRWRGFSNPEADFRWSATRAPLINFTWNGATNGTLNLRCQPFGEQRVSLYLNDKKIFSDRLSGLDSEIVCAASSLKQGENELRFDLPDAQVPGNGDERLLALAIRSFKVGPYIGTLKNGGIYDHRSKLIIWDGFSGAEPEHRWTEKKTTRLLFNWDGDARSKAIRIRCNTNGKQAVAASLNGKTVMSGDFDGKDISILARVENLRRGFNTLSLHLPDAVQPNEQDGRSLALAVMNVEFSDYRG